MLIPLLDSNKIRYFLSVVSFLYLLQHLVPNYIFFRLQLQLNFVLKFFSFFSRVENSYNFLYYFTLLLLYYFTLLLRYKE